MTEESVKSLNDLLGLELDDAKVTTLVDKVEVIETRTTETTTTTTTITTTTTAATTMEQPVEPTKTPESMGRLNAAHASPRAMERASLNSPVGRIGAYKTAVAANDLDAAATALAKASNKTVTAETVKNLNALLDTTLTDDQVAQVVEKTETLKAEATTKASKKTSSIAR
ncbi:hypothetical protein DC522_05070 [Microvirga sp. KLBC 81]|nr:hypothetical protein DC522_05070 [Microvirga sp. KLBC 81]